MRQHLVFTLVGHDRAGLVDHITQAIQRGNGNLEDSRMAVLGAEFAMMMLCSAPEASGQQLQQEVGKAAEGLDLLMTVKTTTARQAARGTVPLVVQVRGADTEGIVYEVVHYLMEQGMSVDNLDSHIVNAPYSGVPLFEMTMRVSAPASVSVGSLRKQIAQVADKLNVDVEVDYCKQ